MQLVLALVFEGIGFFKLNNAWLFNIYMLAELLLLSTVAMMLIPQRKIRIGVVIGLLLCSSVWAYHVLNSGFDVFANWAFLSFSILLTITYLIILVQLRMKASQVIYKQPLFWLSMAIIVYYGCNIPCFTLINYFIKHNPDTAHKIYRINLALGTLRYLLIAYSFYLCRHYIPKSKTAVA